MGFVCSWLSRYNLQSAQDSTLEVSVRHAMNLLEYRTDNLDGTGEALKFILNCLLVLALNAFPAVCHAQAQSSDDGPEANPGRPTLYLRLRPSRRRAIYNLKQEFSEQALRPNSQRDWTERSHQADSCPAPAITGFGRACCLVHSEWKSFYERR